MMSLHSTGAEFRFTADSFKYLAVSGPKAIVTGEGTLNDKAGYAFLVNLFDGDSVSTKPKPSDRLRVKIWDVGTGKVVYDNQPGAADADDPAVIVDGGNLTIHKK
jgi:beta-lactamase superfamily II metal-dependent hydrolase